MSWRNIWRNPTRSLVVMGAVALGIWAAIFMSGFATGMIRSYISIAIEDIISHVQVHHPDYSQDNDGKFFIPDVEEVARVIQEAPGVKVLSVRSLTSGMISSSQAARGIRIKAVDPLAEAGVTGLDKKVVEGEYFVEDRRNQILVSEALAEKLEVKLRSKVVVTFQDLGGEITAAAFRIGGIFKTGSKPFDESHVFVQRQDLNRLLAPSGTGNGGTFDEGETGEVEDEKNGPDYDNLAHEIAFLLHDPQQVNAVRDELLMKLPSLKIETYREISPDLQLYESQMKSVSIIYLTVIMLALIFGIVNTMLMAVLERIRELGMLMAIGMNKLRVFSMIMLEAVMLCLVAAPFGLLLGYLTVAYLRVHGINLSAYSETLRMYGMSSIVYFDLEPIVYWQVPVAVALTAVAASIYPAWKAIRLRPVEAMRKI
jgi:putative ABC transport system permease protein